MLAAAAGLPRDARVQTVSDYNEALVGARLESGSIPPRSNARYGRIPIVKRPCYAVPICAGITYTMGGISVDEHARALRADGSVIEGLYALGAAAGGLEGGPAIGYVGGLAKSAVTALVAAEHAAAALAKT